MNLLSVSDLSKSGGGLEGCPHFHTFLVGADTILSLCVNVLTAKILFF